MIKLEDLGFDKKCIMSYNYIERTNVARLVYGSISRESYTPAPKLLNGV